MAYDKDGRRLVSNSEIDTYRSCPRHWWLRYYRRLAPAFDPLPGCAAEGTLVHAGLEMYYSGRTSYSPEATEKWMEDQRTEDVASCGEDLVRAEAVRKAHTSAIVYVRNYLRWAEETGVDDGLTFTAVEEEVKMPLTERTVLRGKLDLLAEEHGYLNVVDHKSVTAFVDAAWAHIRGQFLTYGLLAEYHWARRVTSVLLNLVKRAANPKTAPAQRTEVYTTGPVLDHHYRHLISAVRDMEEDWDRLDAGESHHDVVPPNATRDCTWKCQFFAVCPMFDRGEDAEFILSTEYREEDPDARYDTQEEA